jgi:N-acetylated-alpha-linked acidic dipeptidase
MTTVRSLVILVKAGEEVSSNIAVFNTTPARRRPSPDGVVINLVNHMESKNVSAIDVIGTIKGTIENEVVILGNHRDAWAAGAGEPNSGSAALNEVIRSLGVRGWKPRRTLIFASWDGHESRVWGSQLWLHANLPLHLNTTVES